MSEEKEIRSAPLGLRLKPSLKSSLKKAAADDRRPVASYVEKLLTEHLLRKGYLKK